MLAAIKIKSPRILVVEDENIIALDIKISLKNLGFCVCGIVSSGEESIEKVSALMPDLILMDIKLKGKINGIVAANEIYKNYKIPIVYLSAYGDDATIEKVRKSSEFGFVNKPFADFELEGIIKKTLHLDYS